MGFVIIKVRINIISLLLYCVDSVMVQIGYQVFVIIATMENYIHSSRMENDIEENFIKVTRHSSLIYAIEVRDKRI